MSARSGGDRLRRTWPQRLLICFNACCVVVALVVAGLVAYAKQTVAQIPRTTISAGVLTPVADLAPGDPQNFLIVGVDDDTGLAEDDPIRDGRDGQVAGLRSDTIMVVRIDPKNEEARILSFPRDLWVEIPGQGRNRINAAIQYGESAGPSLLIQTLKENFGIDINHYVQVNFAGFKSVINQIGGVQVYLNNPVRDGYSGLNQPEAGCVTLDADQSLAYARSRHLQYQQDGRWRGDPTSDIGRISRQQDFTKRVIKRAFERGASNPATLRRLVENGVGSIELDRETTPADLIKLGQIFKGYDADELKPHTLPVTDAVRGGAMVLELVEGAAEPTLALFRGTGSAGGSAADLPPSSVTVRVLNGTGKQNQGAGTTDELSTVGFKVVAPGNDTLERHDRSEVRYRPGDEAAALLVARHLGTFESPLLVPDESVEVLTVITGDDLLGVLPEARPAAEVVTTTTTTTTTTTIAPEVGDPSTTGTGSSATTTAPTDPGVPVTEPEGYLPGTPPDGTSCG